MASLYVTSHISTGFDKGKIIGRLLMAAIFSTTGFENAPWTKESALKMMQQRLHLPLWYWVQVAQWA